MSNIITVNFGSNRPIDLNKLKSNKALRPGLIAIGDETPEEVLAVDHTSEPIKSMDDIDRVCSHLIECERYRDYMLFVVGINFGLRVSDLRMLTFSNLINDNFTFKDGFQVFEQKTRNTRKRKKNRYITINQAVMDAVTTYLEHTPGVKLSDYMFRSEASNNTGENIPISRMAIDNLLKRIAREVSLNIKMSSHTLRKTFAYHQMVMSGNDPRKLILLSKMLGHSSITITLDYIGITDDEIQDAYKHLNLGSKYNYIDSKIYESEVLLG